MKDKKQEKEITFQLKAIELLNFEMNHPENPLPPVLTYHFNLNLEQRLNPENKLVVIVTKVEVLHEDKQTKLASLRASCIFELTNFDDFINKDSKKVSFPENAIATLNSISISTVRGIMFSQFKGTFLHNAILPLIDTKAMISDKKNEIS
jgi:hypothetical protein